MVMHTGTHTYDVSLAGKFQKRLSTAVRKHGVIDQGKYKNGQNNNFVHKGNIIFARMLMLRAKM